MSKILGSPRFLIFTLLAWNSYRYWLSSVICIHRRRYRILVILGAWDKIPFNRRSWAGIRSQPLQELNLGYCPSSGFIEMRDKMINYLVPDKVSWRIRTTYVSCPRSSLVKDQDNILSCPRSCLTKDQDNIHILSQIKFDKVVGQHMYLVPDHV